MNNKFRFDFGAGLPVEGFIKVTSDTIYSEEQGFGIEKNAEAVLRNKGEKKFLRDFLLFNDNTFKMKIENGVYNIRIYTGDYDDEGDVTTKFNINGKEVCFWVNDSVVKNDEITIEVTNSVLEIKASDGKHVCLNAVEIAPKHSLQKAEVISAVFIEKEKQDVTLSWKEIDGAYAYLVMRKNKQNGETDKKTVTHTLVWKDSDVSLCENYEYMIIPIDDFGFKAAETAVVYVSITDGKEVNEKITGLTAEVSEKSVNLQWNRCDAVLYYRVYKKPKYGLSKVIATVEEPSYTDNAVVTCVPFEYAVEGVTTSGLTSQAKITSGIAAKPVKRWMETLDRGLVAVKAERGIFVSWRLNAYEYEQDIAFHIYRNNERITEIPIKECTSYLDIEGKSGDNYTVRAVKDGKMEHNGATTVASEFEYIPIKLDKPEPYTTPDGNTYEYTAHDVIPADLDGDGEYEFVIKWLANPKDNSQKGYTGVYYVDAYKLSGERLWRINLGVNIRAGAHYAQIMVYDFDNDGKAELICKTADGTTDAFGTVVGDAEADYRNKDGFILEGHEYLSAFDGETGRLLDTVDYDPPRGNVREWGDSWGNRVDRFLACVAYLDGENPSAVMCRGYYDHGCPTVLAAYDLVGKKLVKRWKFLADKDHNIEYTAQGNHNLGVGDIDGDGMDEIVYGAMAVDHDGTGIYSTGLGHGDGMHLGKFTPKDDGLDFFQIHEDDNAEYGYEVRNPATGEIAWGYFTGRDTARGMCAKVDPRYEGNQIWARNEQLYTFDGELIEEEAPKTCKFPIWWDGDLLRELLDYIPDDDVWQNGRPVVYKWDWENKKLKTIFKPEGARSILGTKGTPCLQADILGDWREELIFTNEDSTELRIYTATTPTKHKFYTLMHDHVYRLAIAWQNTAYNQPPHTGFYIGNEMKKPAVPLSKYVRGENIPEFTEEV